MVARQKEKTLSKAQIKKVSKKALDSDKATRKKKKLKKNKP